VGDHGRSRRSRTGLRLLATPFLRASFLYGIDCAGTSSCMAVGFAGFGAGSLAEPWNGQTWLAQAHLRPAEVFGSLIDVSCAANALHGRRMVRRRQVQERCRRLNRPTELTICA
jgi:hypothetical protein